MPKFTVWDILNRKWMSETELYDIPYGELFMHTPDSRAINLYMHTGLKDRKQIAVCDGHYLLDITNQEVYEVVYIQNTASFEMRELSTRSRFSFTMSSMRYHEIIGHRCTHAHIYDPHSEHAKYSKEVAEVKDATR